MKPDYNVVKFRRPAKAKQPPQPKRWPVTTILFLAFVALWFGCGFFSPWPVPTTLAHLAAAVNCDTARAVGLAPAKQGKPGYWRHLDRDDDGIACEPWPRHPRR
jgi:hypothetical protein